MDSVTCSPEFPQHRIFSDEELGHRFDSDDLGVYFGCQLAGGLLTMGLQYVEPEIGQRIRHPGWGCSISSSKLWLMLG